MTHSLDDVVVRSRDLGAPDGGAACDRPASVATVEADALRLAAIVESSDDAIIGKQLDGTITSWNGAAERLFGYSAVEIVGLSILTLIPEDRKDEEIHIIERLQRGERVEHFETVRRHKSGAPLDISLTISPIRRADGTIIGASKIARDITHRKRADALLRQHAEQLEILYRVSGIISRDLDLERIVQAVTDEATAISGARYGAFFYNDGDGDSGGYRLFKLSGVSREGFEKLMPRMAAILAGRLAGAAIARSAEIRKDLDDDGDPSTASYLAVPVVSSSGEVIGGLFFAHGAPDRFGLETEMLIGAIASQAAVAMDNARLHEASRNEIVQRMEAEKAKDLLLHEIKHRVKNTLATIQALASQTLRHAPADEKSAFVARLHALSEAHDLLTQNGWKALGLSTLIHRSLRPFAGDGYSRIMLAGPDARLSANKALILTMALHELGTNAVKYGGLSNPAGRIALEWRLTGTSDHPLLRLHWRESDGPPVVEPERQGFGSRMIASALRGSDGTATFAYHPAGLAVDMELRL